MEEEMANIPAVLALVASNALANVPVNHVEKVFWNCDYAVTWNMLDPDDAELCSHAYERLKAEKFDNDFQKFLGWWQANKQQQYAMRANK